MHHKIETSVKSLIAWTDKIIQETKGKDWQLRNFVETFNMEDYLKFYKELEPHILLLQTKEPELFDQYALTYITNGQALAAEMKEPFFLFSFLENILDGCLFNRPAKGLMNCLQQIYSNAVNIDTALKVLQS